MIKTDGNMFIRRLFFPLWQNLSSFWNVLLKLCCTFNYGKFRLLISTSRKTQVRWRFLVGCSIPEWWYIRHFFFFFASITFITGCVYTHADVWMHAVHAAFSHSRPLHSFRMTDPLSSMKMACWQLLQIPRASSIFDDLMIYIGRNADPGHTEIKSKL